MTTVFDIAKSVKASTVDEKSLEAWAIDSDLSREKEFYGADNAAAQAAVEEISKEFVSKYLNCNDTSVVPIRRKTKFLLVLNNFALYKPVRSNVFTAIKELDSIFEDSMKREGKMPFDSELGRMSEHVLVLMMRVLNYKFKAADVHEFAENNTQFAVQLLLAVLLKEPPYEFELRCNCISGLLGFTQPQAFFSADDKDIKFHECEGFTGKIDFTLDLMLRLSAVQVLNDVITAQMFEHATVQPLEHLAVTNTMRCIMNIFQFSSKGSQQWRQHVLLSTTFIDGATILYIQGQIKALESLLSVNIASPQIPSELLRGLTLAFKFAAFATFRMGRHALCLRPLCAFAYNLLNLPLRHIAGNAALMAQFRSLYANFFTFLCNIDALAGDEDVVEEAEDLIPELTSAQIRDSIIKFLRNEINAIAGAAEVQAWGKRFKTVESDALVFQESKTWQEINGIFDSFKPTSSGPSAPAAAPPAPAPPTQAPSGKTHLEDLPSLAKKSAARSEKKKKKKVDSSKAGQVIEQKITATASKDGKATTATATGAVSINKFACALNGHTMKVPVTSPYGHNYEKETIEQWIKQSGPVCPITGKPLHLEDLKPNKQLQNEIMAEVIRETMKTESQENTADLYDF